MEGVSDFEGTEMRAEFCGLALGVSMHIYQGFSEAHPNASRHSHVPTTWYMLSFGSRQHNKTKLAVTNQSRMRMLSSTHASPSRSFNSIACVPKAFGYTMERVLILLCTVLHCCPSLAHNNTLFYICVCQSWSLHKCKDGVSQTQIGRSPSFTSIKNINAATFSGPVQ
jgi:hypothetical protein